MIEQVANNGAANAAAVAKKAARPADVPFRYRQMKTADHADKAQGIAARISTVTGTSLV